MLVACFDQIQTLQARERKQRGIDFASVELAQPRLDVAAQRHDAQIRPYALGDRLPARRCGPEARAARQFGECARLAADEDIARVLAFEAGGQ